MSTHDAGIIINDATSQYDRWLVALDAGYAKVYDKSFQELLNFAPSFARLVNFYNLQNQIEGDWVEFFLTDTVMIIASIEAINLSEIESRFNRLERLTRETQDYELKFKRLRETFEVILGLARLFDLLLKNIHLSTESETARLLRQFIVAEIDPSLNEQLRLLIAYDWGAGLPDALGQPIGLDYSGFSKYWNLSNICADGSIYKGRTNCRKINHALPYLDPIFYAFIYALSDLKRFAAPLLAATLRDNDHKPHIALYMAFVQLFKRAQHTINSISSRYAKFYYRDILRESYRAAIPDNVYLNFTLSAGLTRTSVPIATLFSAGQDANGQDILYASDKSLSVTEAIIQHVRALRVIYGTLLSEDAASGIASPLSPLSPVSPLSPLSPVSPLSPLSPPSDPVVIKRILASEIAVDEKSGVVNPKMQGDWATFGGSVVGTEGAEVTTTATLGFAIASPYLLLTGGARSVSLNIQYAEEFEDETLEPMLQELSAATGLSSEAILISVLQAAFTLYLSTEKGWFPLQSYTAKTPLAVGVYQPSFSLSFELPPTAPAIIAYDPTPSAAQAAAAAGGASTAGDPEVNATNPAPSLPTLKAYLSQDALQLSGLLGTVEVHPVSLLSGMPVTEFRIDVDVDGLSPLTIANTDGPVDTKTPFLVFGGVPVVGSYLLISHKELFVKAVAEFDLAINWFNLPQTDDGFKGYYKDYVIGPDGKYDCNLFNNRVFHGGLSIQNPGMWDLSNCYDSPYSPPSDTDVLLFRTEPDCIDTLPDGRLCAQTDFGEMPTFPCTPPLYYDPATSAIKLELTGPPYAFGNDLYAPNVLNSVMEALPDSKLCEDRCPAENQVLQDAAQCIATCESCVTSGGQNCVYDCEQCLAALLLQSLEQCLSEARGLPVEDGLRKLIEFLESVASPPQGMTKAFITERRSDLANMSAQSLPACLQRCLQRCLSIFDAMLCVLECSWSAEQNGSSAGTLNECLESCRQMLLTAYNTNLQSCLEDCVSLKKEIKYPNAPYLPQATSLSVSYSSVCRIPTTGNEEQDELFFHLLPFGGYKQVDLDRGQPLLLPDFTYEASLYIGFAELVGPQVMTLLFQMASGGDPAQAAPPVVWEYLSDNEWVKLPSSKILYDSTNGLQNTGLIALSLPEIAQAGNDVLSSDYQWLRASVSKQPELFPNTISIYPHAVLTTWQGSGAGEYLGKPLPAQTIKSSVQPLPAIATINQPMESFGGSPPETERTFKIRVGERLRHKERAILEWDYERLVLERFPTIWKVKALPARSAQTGDAPGNVLVVVVAGKDTLGIVDPTVPQATGDMLSQIHDYLKGYTSPFVQLHVVNPVYVRIQVTTTVQFRDEDDPGAFIDQLNQELVQYLSPWFYDVARATEGGRYVTEDDISEFIQTRPYVAAMLSLKLEYAPATKDLDWYFLTSAKQHRISTD